MNAANENKVGLAKVAQIWIIICIIANTALLLYALIASDLKTFTAASCLPLYITAFSVAGFVLLLSGRTLGFIIVCVCVMLNVLAGVLQGTVTVTLIGSAAANLLLTWAFVGKSLKHLIPVNIKRSALSVVFLVLLTALGVLTVILGLSSNEKHENLYTYDGPITIHDENGNTVMEHSDFVLARLAKYNNQYCVMVTLSAEGTERFKSVASENINKELSIRIGDEEILRPIISSDTDIDRLIFSALTTTQDARALAENINDNLQKYKE